MANQQGNSQICQNFENIFKEFIQHIKENYNLDIVSSNYTPVKSCSELVVSALNLLKEWPQYERYINILDDQKDDSLSKIHRNLGNPFYAKKNLSSAIDEYNLSIIYATHPVLYEHDYNTTSSQVGGFTSLALAYTNRSAALYDLGLFELALLDINKSIQYGYPNKFNKIAIRKAKCAVHVALTSQLHYYRKQFGNVNSTDDDEELNKYIIELNKSMLSIVDECLKGFYALDLLEKEYTELKNTVKSIIQAFLKKARLQSPPSGAEVTLSNQQDVPLTPEAISKLQQYGIPQYMASLVPSIENEHPTIKGLSSNVELQYQSGRGRFLVAKEDILPGSVLAVDPGYGPCGMVLPQCSSSVCSGCLIPTIAPLPCHSCTQVVFCTEACRRKAWFTFHRQECCLIATLRALDMGKNTALALRMVTVAGLTQLQQFIRVLQLEEERDANKETICKMEQQDDKVSTNAEQDDGDKVHCAVNVIKSNESDVGNTSNKYLTSSESTLTANDSKQLSSSYPAALLGFDPTGFYNPSDYRTIYNLVGNKEVRSVGDLFKRSVMAAMLVKLLENGGRFFDYATPVVIDVPNSSAHLFNAPANENSASLLALVPGLQINDNKDDNDNDKNNADNASVDADRVLVGSVLLHHILNLPCNAHSITAFHVVTDCSSCYSEEVGANAFGLLSLTNHSCAPNCYRQSYGSVGVLRAIDLIQAGSEVSDCYCSHFAIQKREDRQQELLRQYCFSCHCRACAEDWHIFECNCREKCGEEHCRKCMPRCKKGRCNKGEGKTVSFILRCLRDGCTGIMSGSTNACDMCGLEYRKCDVDVLGLKSQVKIGQFQKLHSGSAVSDDATSYNNNTHESFTCAPSVLDVIDHLEGLITRYDTAAVAMLKLGDVSEGNFMCVRDVITALTRLVVLPNKTLLRAQEMVKFCYDRCGAFVLDPKEKGASQ